MKKLFFLACILLNVLFGTVTEPLTFAIGSGYREDHFKWKISADTTEDLLIYQERYKHPRYLQTNASLRLIERDIYLFGNFAYSFFAKSEMHQKDRDALLYFFDFKNQGYDLESALEIGLAVNLTPERLEKIILIPLLGYSSFWKIYKRRDPRPLEINGVASDLNKRLKQVWFGPYLGANLEIIPSEKIAFDLAYHFSWLKLKHKSTSDLIEDGIDNYKIINSKMDGHSHYALGKIRYVFSKNFTLALVGKYNYFLSRDKAKVDFVSQTNALAFKNNFFSRWWYGFLGIEFNFQY